MIDLIMLPVNIGVLSKFGLKKVAAASTSTKSTSNAYTKLAKNEYAS